VWVYAALMGGGVTMEEGSMSHPRRPSDSKALMLMFVTPLYKVTVLRGCRRRCVDC